MPAVADEPTLGEFAPAKINLTLAVKGRRPDGFHALQSLVAFAACGDVLTARPAPMLSLEVTGPFAHLLAGEQNNLVMKAARLLAAHPGGEQTARLTLEKNLPVASGIGGGSADAAATLRLLRILSGQRIEPQALAALALGLGSDVPVCLETAPAFMWGKGELIKRLDRVPDFWFVLINPGVAVSTAEVFARLDAPDLAGEEMAPDLPHWSDLDQFVDWLQRHSNDLERPALTLAPVIAEAGTALDATQGCRLARMSGSGATCFGIFADEAEARNAAAEISTAHPAWWVVAARRL